ncbi:MAG: ABC transporter substrate binding protein [Candidatus Acidiferrales bacterium]
MMALHGGSFGFQLEGQTTNFVLLLMNARAASSILSRKVELGREASAAAGPVGRIGSGRNRRRDASRLLSSSRARGLFAGGYGETNLENCQHLRRARRLLGNCLRLISMLSALLAVALASVSSASAQEPVKKDVLILNEVGLSHALTDLMTQQIVSGVRNRAGHDAEFFSENLDLLYVADKPAFSEREGWLVKQYGGHKFEVVVAIGPDTIRFLANHAHSLFSEVPIVICGSSLEQAGTTDLDSRFTGTWQKLEPAKTLEAALRLFPNTRHVFVVGGNSAYDRVAIAATKELLSSFQPKTEFSYLVDMEMGKLLEKLRNLPENSIVLYISFFEDSVGNKFLNATKALPMVASAANAPVFGMSDTYLGHGIVGGDLMNFREQGRVTAEIVSELLDGEKAEDIPIKTFPGMFMFDWRELKRWHVPESRLPYGSVVLFREPSLWERTKWLWLFTLLIVLAVSAFGAYLQYIQRQLKSAQEKERHLSSELIHAEEQERRRIALELHDDFSQRLAVLSLGLENVDEVTPPSLADVHERLHELVKSTSELSTDLHTLSHRLHSSTLESLGLVPAVAALCKEFTTNQGIRVDLTSTEIPRSINPDTALCVFRIVQEGLRNLKKHSGAEQAKVDLKMTGERLEITVRDEGYGFDLRALHKNEGLGIRSMEERARSLGGKFEIHSRSGKGTTLKASLPLTPDLGVVKKTPKGRSAGAV